MKNIIMTASIVMSSVSLAQIKEIPDSKSSSTVYPYDWYHRTALATAYGSSILTEMGKSVEEWKDIDAYNWCGDISVEPMPIPPSEGEIENFRQRLSDDENRGEEPSNPQDPVDPFPCQWDIMVTTDYDLTVCPDGQAFVTRTGYGVSLNSKTEGDFFEFSEDVSCDNWPFPISEAQNSKRPFNLKSLQKSYR